MKEFITRSVLQNIKGDTSGGGEMIPDENLNSVKGFKSTGTGKYMGKNKSAYSSLYLQRSPEKTAHAIAQDCLNKVSY